MTKCESCDTLPPIVELIHSRTGTSMALCGPCASHKVNLTGEWFNPYERQEEPNDEPVEKHD